MNFRLSVLLVAACLILGIDASAAPISRPHLNAQVIGDGQVRLKISSPRLRSAVVFVDRSLDGGKFYRYVRITSASSSQTLIDFPNAETVEYRAKVRGRMRAGKLKGKLIAAVSNTVSVDLTDSITPPAEQTPSPEPTSPASPPAPIELGAGESFCPNGFAEQVLYYVNIARAAAGLSALALDAKLNWASVVHSDWMIRTNTFAHDGWYEEILSSGFEGTSFGQNIARFISSPAAVVEAWMNSPGHRANILKASYNHLGVSCIRSADGEMWWTQDFAS